MRCDAKLRNSFLRAFLVSIPAGFSDALRPGEGWRTILKHSVSIPAGFSDALRLTVIFQPGTLFLFQSLLGFLMRCDASAKTITLAAP